MTYIEVEVVLTEVVLQFGLTCCNHLAPGPVTTHVAMNHLEVRIQLFVSGKSFLTVVP